MKEGRESWGAAIVASDFSVWRVWKTAASGIKIFLVRPETMTTKCTSQAKIRIIRARLWIALKRNVHRSGASTEGFDSLQLPDTFPWARPATESGLTVYAQVAYTGHPSPISSIALCPSHHGTGNGHFATRV